jgi:hypothetical protein
VRDACPPPQTIGGTVTAYSASLVWSGHVYGRHVPMSVAQVASAAKAANMKLSCVHVPKSIFNDLPLPENARTFGFDTARQVTLEPLSLSQPVDR